MDALLQLLPPDSIQYYKPIKPLSINEIKDNQKFFLDNLKKRLTKELLDQLSHYYDKELIHKLLLAIHDFQVLIEFEEFKDTAEINNINKVRRNVLRSLTGWINTTNDILKIPGLLSNNESNYLTNLRERFSYAIEEKEADMISLYKGFSLPSRRSQTRDDRRNILMLMPNIKIQRSRPYSYKNAAFITIYKILTDPPPKGMARYKEWCKQMTAAIANKAYGTIIKKEITKRHIDNALHTA